MVQIGGQFGQGRHAFSRQSRQLIDLDVLNNAIGVDGDAADRVNEKSASEDTAAAVIASASITSTAVSAAAPTTPAALGKRARCSRNDGKHAQCDTNMSRNASGVI
ncbi:MAG: hypothetical protein K1X71_00830 [Pirellulales bacterium]|nr:hypothetical protein [Pirellulales bacterium]